MIYIAENAQEAFARKSKNKDAVLVGDPTTFVSNFLLGNLNKFGIIPFHQEIINLMEFQKNIHVHKIHELIKAPLLRAITRHRKNNVENILNDALVALKNGQDVITTPEGGVLLLECMNDKGHSADSLSINIETNVMVSELMEIYNNMKNPSFYPIALERLLKLFSLFYNKNLETDEKKLIGKLQVELLNLKEQPISVSLEDIKKILSSQKEIASNIQNVNIFDKIEEEIEILESMLEEDFTSVIVTNNDEFLEMKTQKDSSDEFFNMYEKILY